VRAVAIATDPQTTVARPQLAATVAAVTTMAVLGSSFAVLEELHGYPASGGQALRYAAAAGILALLVPRRIRRPTRRQLVQLTLLAASGLAAFNLLVLAAERSMDPASVGVIVAAAPVLLALAGPLQAGRAPQTRVVAAASVVAAGAVVVQGAGGEMTAAGVLAALGALACEAAFSLLAAPLLAPLGPVAVTAWSSALAVPLLLAAGLVFDGPAAMLPTPTAGEALALAWLALAVTPFGFVLWFTAVASLGVDRAGLFLGMLPVFVLLAAAVLGESALTPARAAGALAVGAGISLGLLASSRRRYA
jgi:drug/metabolite transporter (DMT)-like permease